MFISFALRFWHIGNVAILICMQPKLHSLIFNRSLSTGNPRCILTSKLRQHMEPLMKTQSNSCLDHLLVDVSPKGRKLLRSMLEYEPDLRPNASRLLKNSYFLENPDKYEGRCSVGKWTQKMAASFS